MIRQFRIALVSGILLASAGRANAYCTEGPMRTYWGQVKREIPVYLVAPNSTFHGLDRNHVAHRIRVAMDNWNEEGGANFRATFGGIVSASQSESVNVREGTSCGICADASACEQTIYNWLGYRIGSEIYFEQVLDASGNNLCRPLPGGGYAGPWTLDDMLRAGTHELGHAWGLEDEYLDDNGNPLCESTYWDSAMSEKCGGGRFVARRDIGALQSLYARRAAEYNYRQSTDFGLSWSTDQTANATEAWSRLGSLGTKYTFSQELFAQARFGASPKETLVWRGTLTQPPTYVLASEFGGSDTSSWSWDVAAAARKSTYTFAVAVRSYETEVNCTKGVRVYITEDAGETWTARDVLNIDGSLFKARGEGVSLAYDDNQDVYVAAFVSEFNVYTATFGAQAPYTAYAIKRINNAIGQAYQSEDHPSVVCNWSAYTPSENCMLAWMDRSSAYLTFKYARFAVDSARQVALGAVQSHSYQGWQSPTLAAVSSSSYPFAIAIKQYDTAYGWRYQASTGTFVDQRNIVTRSGEGLLMGALGLIYSNKMILKYVPLSY